MGRALRAHINHIFGNLGPDASSPNAKDEPCMGYRLRLTVDGVIFQLQTYGGISRLFSEILPRMCHQFPRLYITLLDGRQTPAGSTASRTYLQPRHSRCWTLPTPRRIWQPAAQIVRRLVRERYVELGEDRIWHSTYYTMPTRWDGKQVVTVMDISTSTMLGCSPDKQRQLPGTKGRMCLKG